MAEAVAYDLESYPNVFTCAVMPMNRDAWWVYEISERRNDAEYLYRDMKTGAFSRMYGFRSMFYDYPLLHYFMDIMRHRMSGLALAKMLHRKTEELISAGFGLAEWQNAIWPRDQHVEQCDLYLLNHFNNHAKQTSLKDLMFNLKCPNMRELPFKPGTVLTDEEIDVLIDYNVHSDTWTTKEFTLVCKDAIEFREKLIKRGTFGVECLNYNDVKIGEQFFIQRLEKLKPGVTRKDAHGRKPQTIRRKIHVADVILPYVKFERPELRELLQKLRDTTVDGRQIKGSYNFKVPLEGVELSIGAGGIHAALDRVVVRSNAERVIIDIDVTGYYPNVAIENRFYPQHIGPVFTTAYAGIRDDREHAKSTPGMEAEAGILKLSNNGAFGKTGEENSVLRDTQCLLSITVNGQLLQSMLAEWLLEIPGLRLLQLNTDGLTVDLPRKFRDRFDDVCHDWQKYTRLKLEFKDFDALWLRDVNNYLALDTKGKRKRKGAYDWEMLSGSIGGQKAWNRDFSHLVVPKAAEAALIDDIDPADFIEHHPEPYDFLLRQRVKGGDRLMHGPDDLGKLARYYIAHTGHGLTKIMKPLKGKTEDRRQGIHAEGLAEAVGGRKDWRCSICGEHFTHKTFFDDHNKAVHPWPVRLAMQWDGKLPDLNLRWYVQEAEKLAFA